MLSFVENHDDAILEQILVMKHQEETSYKCEDYLQTGSLCSSVPIRKNDKGLPKIPLHLQQAAFEECAQFINMLVIDSNTSNNEQSIETNHQNSEDHYHNKCIHRTRATEVRVKPETSYGYFLQVPTLSEASVEDYHRVTPQKLHKSPSSVLDLQNDVTSSGENLRDLHRLSGNYSSSKSLSSSTSSQEDNLSLNCKNLRHLALWRRQMCRWAYRVVDAFGFYRVSAAVAFSILDRYICTIPHKKRCAITRRQFVLMTITSLYLSIKTSEAKRKLSLFALLEMTHQQVFIADDIREMELTILEALQWKVNPPIASAFVSPLLKLIDSRLSQRAQNGKHQERNMDSKQLQHIFVNAHRLLELSYIDGKLISKCPSSVAISAILLVCNKLKNTSCSHPFQIRYNSASIHTHCDEIRDLLQIQINYDEILTTYRRLERIYRRNFY
jgi:hypothetical protein